MVLFTDEFKELKKASEPLYKSPKSIQETIEIESVLLCRDIDRLFRFAALRPLIDERELHRNGSVKVVEEVAPVLKNGGLVVCLCKLIVNIFKGDGL